MQIEAQKRELVGKKAASLREKGLLPAVVYGPKGASESVSVHKDTFMKIWKKVGESTLVDLKIEGGATKSVLIYDVMLDPVKSQPLHADFYEVSADKEITAHIQLEFIGEPEAVRVLGGSLLKVTHEIEITALPKNLPHLIEIDISKLKTFDDHILLKDITLPKGVTLIGDPEGLVAKVNAPRSDEEIAQLSETTEVNLDSIEVEKKGKKEEEGSEEPAGE